MAVSLLSMIPPSQNSLYNPITSAQERVPEVTLVCLAPSRGASLSTAPLNRYNRPPMYYPVNLNVTGEACLVVGGGTIAARKAKALCRAGASVTVVSPAFSGPFKKLKVRRIRRKFRAADTDGKVLAISATDVPAVNRAVFRACRHRNIPVNVVDVPDLCTFIVPSIIRKGEGRVYGPDSYMSLVRVTQLY